MAARAEAEAARVRAGLSDPKAEARRRHASRPLSEHLADWLAHPTDKGNTAKHAALFVDRARRVAALVKGGALAEIDPPKTATKAERDRVTRTTDGLLGSARLADLTPDAVQRALAVLKAGGRSLATCNHHRAAIRGFSRWAWRDGRTADDALAGVTGFNAKEDRRHDRRTLGLDDLRRLIGTAHQGPVYQEMTGPARALCYRLAVATGLRSSEIKSITPASFAFDREPAAVTVAAGYTKNGAPATLPLPPDLAADLALSVATIPPGRPVFRLPDRGADMLKPDLAAAGIPYRDGAGLVFDFHALRCQCATLADQSGSSPRVVQKLMRHSTLELTGRYTRPGCTTSKRRRLRCRPCAPPETSPRGLRPPGRMVP
jgi:integrase